jgi:hypothetical protein
MRRSASRSCCTPGTCRQVRCTCSTTKEAGGTSRSSAPPCPAFFRSSPRNPSSRSFIRDLTGRDKAEAIALVKLLEEQGNRLRRPQSGALGEGLFELRGKQVRIFSAFLPGRAIVLLDGEIKKRDAIPKKTLERVRGYQREAVRRGQREGR